MTLQEKLEDINAQIQRLTLERENIEHELFLTASTFEEKFRIWYYSENKRHESWIIDNEKYPLTGTYFRDEVDMDRHRTYVFTEYFEDEMGWFIDEGICNDPQYADEKPSAKMIAMFKEMMNKNLGSFKCDW